MKRDRIDLLLALLLFLTICVASLPFSDAELLSPDASGYLDMGRNLFSGKGPVISYNLCQFWQKKYYPFLPYTHPIFPIVAGLILPWGGVRAVIDFTIVLLAINCVMLYTIVRLYADYLSGFLITLFMGFSPLVVLPAIFPWTEQLHLFLLLLTVFIYLRNKEVGFLIGALSAVICIVRVAAVYNVLAFAIALVILRGFSKRAVREYGKAAVAFFAIFSSYELLCFCKYGALYPQYFAASETYRMAEIYPGAFYRNALPVLNMERLPYT